MIFDSFIVILADGTAPENDKFRLLFAVKLPAVYETLIYVVLKYYITISYNLVIIELSS